MSDQRLSELALATTSNPQDLMYLVQGGVSKRLPVSSLAVTRLVSLQNSSTALSLVVDVPATTTSTGVKGQIAYNSSHLYLCVATNTWRRLELQTW